jgi:hypothetical protein
LTRQLRVATLADDVEDPSAPSSRPPRAARSDDPTDPDSGVRDREPSERDNRSRLDLNGLSVAGITRRRVAWMAAAFVAVWIVVVFARQVGDAEAVSNHAAQFARDNAALAAEVGALEKERELIVEPRYVAQEARGHQLGAPKEIAFSLDPSVAAPVDGSPGSASTRLGATTAQQTPLESWLSLLFGPTG